MSRLFIFAGIVQPLLTLLHDVDKRRADQGGGDGDHGNAYETDDAAQEFSQGGDRVNVAISRGRECHHGPPQSVADVVEGFGLGVALDEIHQNGGKADDDKTCRVGRVEFFAHQQQRLTDQSERA